MAALTTNYRPEPSKKRNELYQQALADLDDAAFLAAVGEIIRSDEFFPTVARIRKVATGNAEREWKFLLAVPTPIEGAWREFARAMNAWDEGQPIPPLAPPTMAITAYLGGGRHLAEHGCTWAQWVAAANAVETDRSERREIPA